MKRLLLPVLLCVAPVAAAQTITSQTETTPAPGIRLLQLRTASPATNAWAALIDLCAEGIHLDATSNPAGLTPTGTWAASVGAKLAVNGDFYTFTPAFHVLGQAAGGGAKWPSNKTGTDPAYTTDWSYQRYGWIAVGKDWVDYSHTRRVKLNATSFGVKQGFQPDVVSHEIPPGTQALVSGFPVIVMEGAPVTCPTPTDTTCFPDRGDMRERHPRTAMGLTRDRRTLILLVVDGRTTLSSGMYGVELASLMSQLGAWQAFNLDGGGSSQMWIAGQGYVNDVVGNNLGNPARSVANHWGVFAGTAHNKGAVPGHCLDRLAQVQVSPDRHEPPEWVDLDNDKKADACLRTSTGLKCARGGALNTEIDVGLFTDANGWDAVPRYSSIRYGDINGDGRTDVCARAAAGVSCWLSTAAAPFSSKITGPALTDANGWSNDAYGSTLRLVDINADEKDDLCARAASGLRCYPSTGSAFGTPISVGDYADADGFNAPDKYMSLRFGDLNADKKADVCGRASTGIRCHLSTGTGFGAAFAGPAWTDAAGYDELRYSAALRMGDIDGDQQDDLCIRSSNSFRCHLSNGAGFGSAIVISGTGNAAGWGDRSNNFTFRLGDIDADEDLDVCARANTGIVCWKWNGTGFDAALNGPALSDATGFDEERFYETFRLADVNGDRKADACVRDGTRLRCWLSDGTAFPTLRNGPAWAGINFEHPSVFHTLALSSRVCHAAPETCNGADDDCDQQIDEGCGADGGTVDPDGGVIEPDAGVVEEDAGWSEPDAGAVENDAGVIEPDGGETNQDAGIEEADAGTPDNDAGVIDDPRVPVDAETSGCGCAAGTGGVAPALLLPLLLVAARRRRVH